MADKVLTAKGLKQAEAILDAAVRCIGEEGYAGTSLQRVADAAGVKKAMVLYYYGSREQLVAAALERLADGFHAELESRIAGLDEPGALIDALIDFVVEQIEDRGVLTAYFGLVAEAATDHTLHAAMAELRAREVEFANRILDRLEANGHQPSLQRELLILAAGVVANGIGIELLQRGRTPELERAVAFARAGAPMLLFE